MPLKFTKRSRPRFPDVKMNKAGGEASSDSPTDMSPFGRYPKHCIGRKLDLSQHLSRYGGHKGKVYTELRHSERDGQRRRRPDEGDARRQRAGRCSRVITIPVFVCSLAAHSCK
ncbi:hypothetical protein EVAR_47992_1 [Eumeta japonica]|uniref:Uncharacterized protein n=1 Tax=Eumeta variegata TaxID=151549 RepID=A0A4C1XMC3_EUMVA|nr:hypothetical protein EVAR_47992_1 [Eumeta japonica]